MKSKRFFLLILTLAAPLASLVFVAAAQEPAVTPEVTSIETTAESTLVFEGHSHHLQACGDYLSMVNFHTPEPAPVVPTSTPDPNAPTPMPTSTPRPAPQEDRVGFPENYESEFKLLFIFNRLDRQLLRIICGNDIAAARQPGEPFDYGSVLVMISYTTQRGADGQPVLDDNGFYIGERLISIHIQRKGEGFGEAYESDRAGEWEFMGYNADGSVQVAPQNTNFCAVCHNNEGGEAVDYVFRTNLFYEGEAAFSAPPVGENEISIYLYAFHEPVLEVKAGTTVTWINDDEANHTVVAAVMDEAGRYVRADEPLFESDVLASVNIKAGESFSFTFDQPGEYLYRCTIHDNMTGRIIVIE